VNKTLRRFVAACGLGMLFFGSPAANAFCTQVDVGPVTINCGGEGHIRVTRYISPILRNDIWGAVWNGNYAQDNPLGDFREDSKRHVESCRFRDAPRSGTDPEIVSGSFEYIHSTYNNAISLLDPAAPDPFEAADRFGKLLHTVQDLYSHSNWINLLGLVDPKEVHPPDLFDRTLGEWPLIDMLGHVQHDNIDDIIIGQIPPEGLPAGWSVYQPMESETPEFLTNEGATLRGLVVGGSPNSPCPDARPPGNWVDDPAYTVDQYSHVNVDINTGVVTQIPRLRMLVHGESRVSGTYDLLDYQAARPCHADYPTWVCIQKDHTDRPDYEQVIRLAAWQTAHEWCRLLNLAKDSQYGYAASSILMALWARPHDENVGPDPITLGACGTPPEVLAGKPGPIEVKIDPQAVAAPSGSNLPSLQRHLVFALYTGDFRRSNYRQATAELGDTSVQMQPLTMCVKPADKLVATVWGWDDRPDLFIPFTPDLNAQDRVLRGATLVTDGPGFLNRDQSDPANQDLGVEFAVTVEGDDEDGDGLSTPCGEVYYGTDPQDADTDDDGLTDGDEVNTHHTDPLDPDSEDDGLNDGDEITYGTDPHDPDSDDDGLTDGDEVHTYGSSPTDADSDDDGLTDGDEVNTHHTDPNDADTDDDLLSDGLEVKYGTDPLNPDTDGDGLPDGKDVEWIQGVIAAMPGNAINGGGNRNAMMNLLDHAEADLLKGKTKQALQQLSNLRTHNDGCGAAPDKNDWIIDCTIQTEVRMLVDLLIANVQA
jgi:hypothetical protein